jgi:hypothetical protein
MHDLPQIKAMNDRAVRKAGNPGRHVEHCSYTGVIETGIVVHSAKQRSTVMLRGQPAADFVRAWMDCPAALKGNRRAVEIRRDQLAEALF